MEKINFGFKGLSIDKEISREFAIPQTQNMRSFFGNKSFETSWQYIETLV